MTNGKLFVISGPSGAGKGSICRKVLERENKNLSISATTRPPRTGEKDGENYFFLSRDTFLKMVVAGDFLEYAEVYGNFYGTPKNPVLDSLSKSEDVILEIDVQGALQVKRNFSDAILIFILPPSMNELENRLKGRGTDSQQVIEKRLAEASSEIQNIREYDYFVVNDDLDIAVTEILSIMKAEKLRISNNVDEIIKRYREEV